jgi:hypothetical protein
VFAAVTGVSIASASVFTKVAVPEMVRHGYSARFACGIVAGSSILGMLIPPSLLMIVYSILAEESVGRMFMRGSYPHDDDSVFRSSSDVSLGPNGRQCASAATDLAPESLGSSVQTGTVVCSFARDRWNLVLFTPTEAGCRN